MIRIFSLAFITSCAILMSGCYEIEETIANITVVRLEGTEEVPVSDAEVRLYAIGSISGGSPRFDTIQYTTEEGFVSFNLSDFYVPGQAGFAVLDIEATKGGLYGEGLIKIDEMMTNSATVVVE
ncbi:MAG: hypothetical protein RLZZ314_1297 [Bacteroidota bacterium]|jgi:hypothetical protein|nr:hypothetical protein [Bacteroidota bacterium]